jgi:hypothetical protein
MLKAIATAHRPHLAAKMTKENGYDEQKHLLTDDLVKAGIMTQSEADDLDGCVDDLAADGHDGAGVIKAARSGEVDKSKLNDDELLKALFTAIGPDDGSDDVDGDDDLDGDDGDGTTKDADDVVTA